MPTTASAPPIPSSPTASSGSIRITASPPAAAPPPRAAGRRIPVTLLIPPEPRRIAAASFLRSSLHPRGIDIAIQPQEDVNQFLTRTIYTTRDSFILGGTPDYPSAFTFLSHLLARQGVFNPQRFDFPAILPLIFRLPSLPPEKEVEFMNHIHTLLEEEALYVPLYFSSDYYAAAKKISAVPFLFGGLIDFARLEVAHEQFAEHCP